MLLADQGDVVDAGGAGGLIAADRVFRAGLGVGVPGDVVRGRGPGVLAVAPDEQDGQVERVEDQFHAPAGERRVDLVLVAVQGDQGRLGHGPPFRPAERLSQVRLGRGRERAAGFPPGQRRLPGLRMLPHVVNRLHPRGEQLVQLGQVRDPGGALLGKLDQETITDSPEKSFDFSLSFWSSGLAVDQLDAQLGAGAQQPRIDERAAVVDVGVRRDPPGCQGGAQRGGQPDGVLGEPEPGGHHRAGVIVDEREKIGFAATQPDRVHRVPRPDLIGPRRLPPPERGRVRGRGQRGQPGPAEHPLDRRLIRRPPALGTQDPLHLHGGPGRVLLLQRHRQLHHLRRGPRLGLARRGDQRVEPALLPQPDPPVQGPPGQPHRPSRRVRVLAGGDRPHQLAPLPRGQCRVGGLPDQHVPEQPDRPGPFQPLLFFLFRLAHAHQGHLLRS